MRVKLETDPSRKKVEGAFSFFFFSYYYYAESEFVIISHLFALT